MKKLHFSFLVLLCLITQSIAAQSWTACAPAEGTFYLYNVGNAGFLRGANDWSTRASLTTQGGIPVTLVAGSGENEYYLSTSPTYKNLYLGADGYVDKGSDDATNYTAWKFVAVENIDNTYFLQAVKTSKYLVGHSSDITKTSLSETLPTNDKGYWKLASKDALFANFSNATETAPIDATFLILDPYFGRVSDPAGVWSGNSFSHNGYESGSTQNYCAECYNKTFDVYQEISGVPNGIYGIQCQGFYRIGGRTDATNRRNNGEEVLNAKYYINGSEGGLMSIFDGSYAKSYTANYNENSAYTVNGEARYLPNNMSQAANCMRKGDYQNPVVTAVVTDGTLRLGVKKTVAVGSDWSIFDNFVLTYYGIDLSSLAETYESMLATAKDLQDDPMKASVKTALNAAVTAAETDVNTESQEWLETQIGSLNTAVANAQVSKALYEGEILTVVNRLKAQSACESVKTTLQSKYDNGEYTTASEVYTIYRPLEIAALGTEANTVYTSVIFNRDFEEGQYAWSGSPSIGGTDTNKCAEKWNETFDVYQTIEGLPNGYYSMSLQGFYRVGNGTNDASAAAAAREAGNEALYAQYYINDTYGHLMSIFDSDLTSTNDGTYNTSIAVTINGTNYYVPSNMTRAAACFTHGDYVNAPIQALVTDGTLRIGVRKSTGNGSDWTIWDNITLTYVGSYEPSDYNDVVINANVENNEVAAYLNDNTYTESSATAIDNYNINAASRNDQPASVNIFLPAQGADATLYVGLASDFSDADTYTVAAGKDIYKVTNLLPQQTYYYKVVGDGDAVVTNGTINTTGHLRMIKADGISNMRDLGGWKTLDGNHVKYGKIFRGSELRGGKSYTASDADLAMLKNKLNIAAEVDLREDGDFANGLMDASAVEGATYYYANLNQWREDALNFKTEVFRNGFNLILTALKAGHAAYFHCIYGADRTGCFAMLLEGLLGLPVDQLYKDYELTSFSSAGRRAKTLIDDKLQYIKALPGENLQEKFYNYWRGAVGISESDLNDFIDIMVEGTSPITKGIADLPVKAVTDGEYYIYVPSFEKFIGRGEAYGTRALGDNYGVPAQVTTNGANVTTIKFLDNNLFLGSDCFTDKAADYINTLSWTIEHRGDDLVLKSHNGNYFGVTTEDNGLIKPRANVASAAGATPIEFKTHVQQKTIVAEKQEASILAAATAAGITAADTVALSTELSTNYNAIPSTATIKSATSGNTADWVLTRDSRQHDRWSVYNTGTYGGEIYQRCGTISQTVTVPHAGLYKLTLNAFYRQGENTRCYELGQKGYELSDAWVSVNDTYFAQIPSWYSDRTDSGHPNTTDEAKTAMDAGKYAIELYAYVGNEKQLTITINASGHVDGCWCLFNNFALTEYAKKVTISETDTEAPAECDFADVTLTRTLKGGQWNGFSLPFSLNADQIAASLPNVAIKQYASAADNEITLEDATEIVAGDPYLVKPVSDDIVNPVFTGVAVENPEEAVKGDGDYKLAAHLYNTGLAVDGSVAYVSTNDSSIKKLTSGGIKGLRSYFQIPTSNGVKALVLKFDNATEVETIDNLPFTIENEADAVFDISGRRVSKAHKGLYIQNGKKVLVK